LHNAIKSKIFKNNKNTQKENYQSVDSVGDRLGNNFQIKINIDNSNQGVIVDKGIFRIFKKIERRIIKFIKSSRAAVSLDFFREYSTLTTVLAISLLIIAGNLNRNIDKGFLFGFYNKNKLTTEEKIQQRLQKYSHGYNLTSAPLAIASSAEDIKPISLGAEQLKQNQIQYQVLTATDPDAKKILNSGSDVAVYKVKNGDTVGSIAQEFKVTIKTILWANDIDDVTKIKPGDKIFILPVSGLKHKVISSDTVAKLAKKYKADEKEIISYNSLPADGRLKIGEEIIIPGGEKEEVRRATPNTLLQRRNYYGTTTNTTSGGTKRAPSIIDKNPKKGGHRFPYGQCTWYVAQHKHVPWGGNAGTWLYHARAYGAKTGKTPKVGAIVVTSESWYGHVAIVTKVKGGNIYIKEMNYKGWAKVSTRAIPIKSRRIKGYIY
jgi:surface antigen